MAQGRQVTSVPARGPGRMAGPITTLGLIAAGLLPCLGLARWWATPSICRTAPVPLTILQPRPEAVYPPGFPAPIWRWHGGTGPFAITIATAGMTIQDRTDQPRWQPDPDQWRAINHPGHRATLTIRGADGSNGCVSFATDPDPVTGSLLFREVILPFADAVRDPARLAWRFGAVTSEGPPPVVLTGLPVCGNCHSFSRDGAVLGMDVDYANDKGSYALVGVSRTMALDRNHVMTWSAYLPDEGRLTFGLLARVSPDGRVVIASVKDRSVFVPVDDLAYSQRFFPVQGILAAYDRERRTITALAGADDPALVQANPVWSPDGRWVYFCRAPAVVLTGLSNPRSAMLTPGEADRFFREHPGYGYGIWRVPWNEGRGGVAEPVAGAVIEGRSCYFPRLTPDGRFLVFCQARQHMLLQPDAELWIVPAAGGTARRMRCNGPGMNSWHSFSPDGRWMVFAGKPDGPYTRLMLTHLDGDGNDTPAVPLERLVAPERAANIPEFAALDADAIVSIREAFLDAESHLKAGSQRHNAGDPEGAERHFRAGLALDQADARLHVGLGTVLAGSHRLDEAVACFREAVSRDPACVSHHVALARALLARALLEERGTEDAAEAARVALALACRKADREGEAAARHILSLCDLHLPQGATP